MYMPLYYPVWHFDHHYHLELLRSGSRIMFSLATVNVRLPSTLGGGVLGELDGKLLEYRVFQSNRKTTIMIVFGDGDGKRKRPRRRRNVRGAAQGGPKPVVKPSATVPSATPSPAPPRQERAHAMHQTYGCTCSPCLQKQGKRRDAYHLCKGSGSSQSSTPEKGV